MNEDPYRLGFEIVEAKDRVETNHPMSHFDPAQMAADQELRRAAMKAGSPYVTRRTFEAKDHPKGSPERERLNQNPVTSDRKGDYPWVLQRRGAEPEYFGRYELAQDRMAELISPHMPPPLPFGGGTPPIPGDPDEVITEGEFAGKTLAEAHAEHFDPAVSDKEFFEKRAAVLTAPKPVEINIQPGMEPYEGNRGKFITTGIVGKDWSPAQGWLVSENPPRICFADGEIVDCDGEGCAVVINPPERPADICFCIDCGGDQPGHETGCGYMAELHG